MNVFNNLLQNRLIFNQTVERCMLERANHYIVDIGYQMSLTEYFLPNGNVTSDSKMHFWKEIDYLLEKFDLQPISLKPRLLQDFRQKPVGQQQRQPKKKNKKKFFRPGPWNNYNKPRKDHQKRYHHF